MCVHVPSIGNKIFQIIFISQNIIFGEKYFKTKVARYRGEHRFGLILDNRLKI